MVYISFNSLLFFLVFVLSFISILVFFHSMLIPVASIMQNGLSYNLLDCFILNKYRIRVKMCFFLTHLMKFS